MSVWTTLYLIALCVSGFLFIFGTIAILIITAFVNFRIDEQIDDVINS